jgi:hypothetical protein
MSKEDWKKDPIVKAYLERKEKPAQFMDTMSKGLEELQEIDGLNDNTKDFLKALFRGVNKDR